MKNSPSLEELLEIPEHFRLPGSALVQMDWHAARALAAIAAADISDFRLVFGGCTALLNSLNTPDALLARLSG